MDKELSKKAYQYRLDVLEMVVRARAGHIGSSMSCLDILTVLYGAVMDTSKIKAGLPDRDRFIMSKGHAAEALYAVLADHGFFPKEMLSTFSTYDTCLAGHPIPGVPGVEAATGALGHGLSVGVGMAIGLKADQSHARVYVLLGDGEMAEGSIWEALMAAAKYRLDNLCAIIDRNRLQISGNTEEVMPLLDLSSKITTFGWDCRHVDGHDAQALRMALSGDLPVGRPLALLADTVKGRGSELMEDKAGWHHRIPDDEEYRQIKAELVKRRDGGG